MTTRLMVVVAHPDDETFGCGSLLLHAAAAGAQTVVVCATRGEAGEVKAGVDAPDGIATQREAELREAAAALGVSVVHLLDFEDSGMSGEPAPRSLYGAPIEDLTTAVQKAISSYDPDIVVTLDGSDGHRDHLRLREVVQQLLTGSATTLYLHCLPRSLMHNWVRHHANTDAATAYTELPDIGTPDDQLTTIINTETHLAARHTAIGLHRSQASPFDGLPDELRRAFLGRDHLIRVNPEWTSGPIETDLTGLAHHPTTGETS